MHSLRPVAWQRGPLTRPASSSVSPAQSQIPRRLLNCGVDFQMMIRGKMTEKKGKGKTRPGLGLGVGGGWDGFSCDCSLFSAGEITADTGCKRGEVGGARGKEDAERKRGCLHRFSERDLEKKQLQTNVSKTRRAVYIRHPVLSAGVLFLFFLSQRLRTNGRNWSARTC